MLTLAEYESLESGEMLFSPYEEPIKLDAPHLEVGWRVTYMTYDDDRQEYVESGDSGILTMGEIRRRFHR